MCNQSSFITIYIYITTFIPLVIFVKETYTKKLVLVLLYKYNLNILLISQNFFTLEFPMYHTPIWFIIPSSWENAGHTSYTCKWHWHLQYSQIILIRFITTTSPVVRLTSCGLVNGVWLYHVIFCHGFVSRQSSPSLVIQYLPLLIFFYNFYQI